MENLPQISTGFCVGSCMIMILVLAIVFRMTRSPFFQRIFGSIGGLILGLTELTERNNFDEKSVSQYHRDRQSSRSLRDDIKAQADASFHEAIGDDIPTDAGRHARTSLPVDVPDESFDELPSMLDKPARSRRRRSELDIDDEFNAFIDDMEL